MKDASHLVKDPRRLDWSLLVVCFLLMGIGLAMVYSATAHEAEHWYSSYWFRQIIHFSVGIVIMIGIVLSKPRFWYNAAYVLYALTILMLMFVLFVGGEESHGAGRWISLGFFNIQPSEFAKIGYLLALARYLTNAKVSLRRPGSFVLPGLMFAVPFLLVLKQPNLSTALVFSATTMVCFYWAGLRLTDLFMLLSPIFSVMAATHQVIWGGLMALVLLVVWKRKLSVFLAILLMVVNVGAGFGSYLVWNSILEDHQRSRILTFLDPMRDPKGAGYQVIQSEVTVGSGGLTGKGFGAGSQTNLAFLPEEHTDFIFSVLAEQFGFIGCVLTLALFFFLLFRALSICQLHGAPFVNYMAVGASTILGFHVFVNVAMALGMAPVTGLPLPFLSYGGSFVMTTMTLVGFLLLLRYKGEDV
ncbi:MAG TPA: rod shape-determining protein RodA [Fibrobacteraceae bacterium]|nr:rod shape-determining protein RodA [Fibrobacteraceae bacterium]